MTSESCSDTKIPIITTGFPGTLNGNTDASSKCENGVFTLLAEDPIPYSKGKTYQVDINAQGNHYTVAIDGIQLFEANDTSFATGTIAFYSWANRGSQFDNVKVLQ